MTSLVAERGGIQARRSIAERAAEDWKTAQVLRAEQMLPSFPAIDPFRDDRSVVTGKLVVLPTMTQRDWIVDMGKAYRAWNEANHWVFAPIESPAMWRIFGAVCRYEKQVAPGVRMDVELIGRLLPNPRLLAGSGRKKLMRLAGWYASAVQQPPRAARHSGAGQVPIQLHRNAFSMAWHFHCDESSLRQAVTQHFNCR